MMWKGRFDGIDGPDGGICADAVVVWSKKRRGGKIRTRRELGGCGGQMGPAVEELEAI